MNKDYGTHILVNQKAYSVAKDNGYVFRELDLICVKGKLQPITFYELVDRAGENSVHGTPDEVRNRLFQQAHELYRKRCWEDAQKSFQAILDKWSNDGRSRAYWKRCREYLFDEPPSGWDGVFTMTTSSTPPASPALPFSDPLCRHGSRSNLDGAIYVPCVRMCASNGV